MTFAIRGKDAHYAWVERTLFRSHYRRLGRADRGLIIRYLMKVSSYSRQQITRLIHQYHAHGVLTSSIGNARTTAFGAVTRARIFAGSPRSMPLHGTLSGPATKKLLERTSEPFGQHQFQRVAGISVSHLYNLRHSTGFVQACPTVSIPMMWAGEPRNRVPSSTRLYPYSRKRLHRTTCFPFSASIAPRPTAPFG